MNYWEKDGRVLANDNKYIIEEEEDSEIQYKFVWVSEYHPLSDCCCFIKTLNEAKHQYKQQTVGAGLIKTFPIVIEIQYHNKG